MTSSLNRSRSILLQTVVAASRHAFLFILALSFFLTAPSSKAIVDTNNNGVSDVWERIYNHGDLLSTFDPQADPDGDGWTNAQEAAAGTDPFDANPPNGFLRPQIEVIPAAYTNVSGTPVLHTPEAMSITWPTLIGKQYTLLFSPNLTAGSWTPVGDPRIGNGLPMGSGIPITQPDGSTPPEMFWRVAVNDIDSDGDGLTNAEEAQLSTDPNNPDTDGDGLNDYEEIILGTSPFNADTDGDGMPDFWEKINGLNPLSNDSAGDPDNDGYTNLEEYLASTDPRDLSSFPLKVIASLPNYQPGHDNYSGYPSGQPVIIYFNKPLSAGATITGSWISDTSSGTSVPVSGTTIILPGRQAIAFVPTGNSFTPWPENDDTPPIYQIDLTTLTAGLNNLLPYHKTFTTTTAAGSLDSGPWFGKTSPGSGYIDAACDTIITARWSEPLDPATVLPANVTLVSAAGNSVACAVDFDYGKDVNLLRITPAQALAPATEYTVTLSTGFHNLTGKAHHQPVSWSFTTRPLRVPPITGAGPYVTAVSPADFSFGIAAPSTVSITFSEAMDPTTLTADHIHVRGGNSSDLPGIFTYAASTLVFQPASAFAADTYFTLTLDLPQIMNAPATGSAVPLQGNNTFVFSTTPAVTGGSGGNGGGSKPPASIAPLSIHYTWGEAFDPDGDSGCSVEIKLYAKEGGDPIAKTLPANPDEAIQVQESGEIAPATTVVLTPNFVPGSDKDLAEERPENGIFILPSDGITPAGMTYLVFRKTPPASGSGADNVEYLGPFAGTTPFTAQCADANGNGPQSLYLVPVPIKRLIPIDPLFVGPPNPDPWYLVESIYAKALPGQKMNLRLEDKYLINYGPGGVILNGYAWTIPDKTFKDYNPDNAHSNYLNLPPAELIGDREVHFYWADSGEKESTVDFNIILNGTQAGAVTSKAKINVEKVESVFTTEKGAVRMGIGPSGLQSLGGFKRLAQLGVAR